MCFKIKSDVFMKQQRTHDLKGWPTASAIPKQFALPKAFQLNASRSVGFFNAHPLNQASLFRGFALKKPLNFVERLCSLY